MAIDLQDSIASKTQNALSAANRAFQLLIAGPNPLSVDGCSIGHGAPQRPIDLDELHHHEDAVRVLGQPVGVGDVPVQHVLLRLGHRQARQSMAVSPHG